MRRFFVALFILLSAALPAVAEEVIRNFVSDVTVNVDGSLDVRETITVNAEGDQIRRGILRDFPTTYIDKNKVRVRVGFDVVSVERDGLKIGRVRPSSIEPTQTIAEIDLKSLSSGVRLQPGDRVILATPSSN